MLALATNSFATEIRERDFQTEDSTVQFQNAPTFLVGNFEKEQKPAIPKLVLIVKQNSGDNVIASPVQKNVPVAPANIQVTEVTEAYESITQCFTKPIYFNFNKSVLTKAEQKKLFAEINECKEKKTPLVVVGYTCNLGTVEQNKKISDNRAVYVGMVLRQNGFNVVESVGKPKTDFVTEDSKKQHLNRRVVVAKVEHQKERK